MKFNKPSVKKSGRTMSLTTTYISRKERILSTVTAKTDKDTDKWWKWSALNSYYADLKQILIENI